MLTHRSPAPFSKTNPINNLHKRSETELQLTLTSTDYFTDSLRKGREPAQMKQQISHREVFSSPKRLGED